MLALKLEFHNLSKTGMKYLSISNKFKNFYYLAISIILLILINVIVFKMIFVDIINMMYHLI